jgi:hypothetical protein
MSHLYSAKNNVVQQWLNLKSKFVFPTYFLRPFAISSNRIPWRTRDVCEKGPNWRHIFSKRRPAFPRMILFFFATEATRWILVLNFPTLHTYFLFLPYCSIINVPRFAENDILAFGSSWKNKYSNFKMPSRSKIPDARTITDDRRRTVEVDHQAS